MTNNISLISAILMIFILAVFAATILFAVYRMLFLKSKRKVPAHQIVKHATDKLPYQREAMEFDTLDFGEWKLNEATGQFTKTMYDGTVITWDNDPSGQVRQERQAAETGAVRRNAIASEKWMRRVNR